MEKSSMPDAMNLHPLLASLSRSLSCMGCGKLLSHPYRGSCPHTFCKECFEGVNLSISKCMVCSAVCVLTSDSHIPLLGDMAVAFERFNNFLTSSASSNNIIQTTDHGQYSPTNTMNAPQKHLSISPSKLLDMSTQNNSLDLLASTSSEVSASCNDTNYLPEKPTETQLIKKNISKKQRFLDEAFEETFIHENPTLSNEISINSLHQSTHVENRQRSVSENSTPKCATESYNHHLSFTASEFGESTQKSLLESQFPVTQNSVLGRMITDIDTIKKNIEGLLDDAAMNESFAPNTLVISDHSPASTFNPSKVNDPHEDISTFFSQELIPLSQDINKEDCISNAENSSLPGANETQILDTQFSPPELVTENYISNDIPSTIPIDVPHISRGSSIVNFIPEETAFFVTAICNSESQVETMATAIDKGWIFDNLSREDLTNAGFRAVNILVCCTINTSNSVRLAHRTIPYMKALLLGYLIVDFAWLQDSVKAEIILSPYSYEINGTVYDKSSRIPLRARFLPKCSTGGIPLLEEYTFTILDEGNLQNRLEKRWNREDIESLIHLCDGKVVEVARKEDFFSLFARQLPLSLRLKSKYPVALTTSTIDYSRYVVSISWLFDSICNLRPPVDITEYLLSPIQLTET